MQFDTTFGYRAIGDLIVLQPLTGQPVDILRCPPDVDSHAVAAALNSAANAVLHLITKQSDYKF